MKLSNVCLLLFITVASLIKFPASGSDWCYTGCDHTPGHWPDLDGSFCGQHRQSPIDIVTSHVETDSDLHDFTFVNFSAAITSMTNNGHTAKCALSEDVEISGGGLDGTYVALQFHYHWGDTQHHPGSEHMVDGHRYPMEMHIVSLKKGLSVDEAKNVSDGIAVLGFFINATEDGDMSGPWANLTSYLTDQNDIVPIDDDISIDDLIEGVNLKKFYRYMGSLTTPTCNEAVVWTVFHEPININKELIQRFPTETGLTNVFRPTQELHGRKVFASPATPLPPSHSWCYDDHCDHSPSKWHLLPDSHCDGERQSPVNIDTQKTVVDEHLDAFVYKEFGNKHAIKYITNTGHAVKCVLEDDLVEVAGGGLGKIYSTLQFHLHWGSSSKTGSEHTVDSKRYPMEMHIVNKRKDLTLEEAVKASDGLAVLGFFIEAEGTKSGSSSSDSEDQDTQDTTSKEAWRKLTNYLSHIKAIGSKVNVTEEISIDDLLGDVNRENYYRYKGSLTTPSCNEAVVWTVFKYPVKVEQSLMDLFPTEAGYENVYRPTQSLHGRKIYVTASAPGGPGPSTVSLLLLLSFLFTVPFNLHL